MRNGLQKIKKRFGEIIAIIFALSGLILFFGNRKWFPDFYNPKFMAVMAFISAFLIILPCLIFKAKNDFKKQQLLNFTQLSLIIILTLSGLGGLGLFKIYKTGFEYDKLLHFFVPFISMIVISRFGLQWYEWSFKKSVVLAVILVLIGGIVWELFEFAMDYFFKTQMLGQYGESIIKDTVWDCISNILGIISGTVVSIKLGRPLKRHDS